MCIRDRGRTVEKTIRCDLHVVESFAPHIVILQLGTNDLSHLDPLVAASEIEDLVSILYEEHSVQQICVCQTLIRKNDAAFNARVKALTKYLKVLPEPIPYCFFGGSQRYFARDGVHLNKLRHYKYNRSLRGAFQSLCIPGHVLANSPTSFRNHFHLPISYLLIWFLFQTKPRVLSPCCFV